MSKITLDLKDYDHVKSNGYTTTIKHKKHGHSITLAHKMLGPEIKDQLEKFCSGGKAMMADGGQLAGMDQPAMPEDGQLPQAPPATIADKLKFAVPEPAPPKDPDVPPEVQKMMGDPEEARKFNERMHSVTYDPTTQDKINYVLGYGKTYKQMQDDAMNGVMGSVGGVGKYASEFVPAMEELAASAPKAFGSVKVIPSAMEAAEARAFMPRAPGVAAKTLPVVENSTPGIQAPINKRFGYADGGEASQEDVPLPMQVPTAEEQQAQAPQIDPNAKYKQLFEQTYAEQKRNNPGEPDVIHQKTALDLAARVKQADEAKAKMAAASAQSTEANKMAMQQKLDQSRQAIGLAPQNPTAGQPSAPQATLEPAMMPKTATPQTDISSDMGAADAESAMRHGVNAEMQGINQGAQAQGSLGEDIAARLDRQQQSIQNAQVHYQNEYQKLNRERQAHIQDINNGHIDPEQYWVGTKDPITGEVKGGHSKIASAIGMILAGFNPTTSPNAAINMLKFQMEQNLEAQKQNLNSKQNLLNANLRQFGNMRDATDMTRIMQNDLMARDLQQAAAKAQGPLAAAAAKQAGGKLERETAPMFQQFAMRRALMSAANDPNGGAEHIISQMRVINPAAAKEMEERNVPGVGMSSIPVPQATRDKIMAHQDLDRLMDQVLQFGKAHSGSVNPMVRAQGDTLMNELQSKLRTAEQQGVYKESEANFIRKTLGGNPAEFFSNYTTAPKVQAMRQIKHQDYSNLLRNAGLRQPQSPIQQKFNFKPSR